MERMSRGARKSPKSRVRPLVPIAPANGLSEIGIKFSAGRVQKPGPGKSLADVSPDLARQWHPTHNGTATPADVTSRNGGKAWWRDSACGHEWVASVCNRARGDGCSVCNGKILIFETSLAGRFPEVAAELHPTKNTKTAEQLPPLGTNRVWWLGAICGHEWASAIINRTRQGSGCPYCSGRFATTENNLDAVNPALAAEWHPTRNGSLLASGVTPSSAQRYWWSCSTCNHEWATPPAARSAGKGCPACSGRAPTTTDNLLATHPGLAAEWHSSRNEALLPSQVKRGTGLAVWWKGACGHEWQATIASRSSGSGCYVCNRPGLTLLAFRDWLRVNFQTVRSATPAQRDVMFEELGLSRARSKAHGAAQLLRADNPRWEELEAWATGDVGEGERDASIHGFLESFEPRDLGIRTSLPAATRKLVLARDNRLCRNPYCPSDPAVYQVEPRGLHIDHIVQYTLGGSDEPDNLQVLCQRCNSTRHARDWEYFLELERQRAAADSSL